MKINIKFWCVFGIVFSVVCASESGAEEMQTCPQGCFCIYDGKFPAKKSMANICGHGVAQRVSCDDANKVVSFSYAGGAYEGTLACARDKQAEYYFDEFSELYITNTGMYGFIGQDLITMPFVKGYGSEFGVYQCPSSYPSSQAGAKTVFDCYKYKDGKKVYYTNNNYENCNEALESLLANLRFSLDKVNKTAQYLQNNLNNQEQKTIQTVKDKAIINTEIPVAVNEREIESKQTIISAKTSDSFKKIEPDKAMINVGISDSLVSKSKKEKIDMLKTQKTAMGKSMRSSGTRYVNDDLETKSDIDTSSNDIGTGYLNNDLEIKKRMISAGI